MNTVWHFEEKTVRHLKGVVWGLSLLLLFFLVLIFTPAPGRSENREAGADLAITQSSTEKGPRQDGRLSYSFEIANQGPEASSEIQLIDTLPPAGSLISLLICQDTCTVTNPVVCELGDLESGESIHVTFFLAPLNEGPLTNRVEIRGSEKDPNLSNNQVHQTLIVGIPVSSPLSLALPSQP